MPLVKAQYAKPLRQTAIVMDLADLEQQAAQIVEQARRQGEQIIAEARQQAQQQGLEIREQARQAGLAEGQAAGMKAGQAQGHDEAVAQATNGLNALIERWTKTLADFQNRLPTHLTDLRVDVAKLALAIAARITRQEALRNKEVLRANTAQALALVTAGRSVEIRIHPDELNVLEGYVGELVSQFRSVGAIELKTDDTITPGGCVLSFGAGQVDARLETQIQRIADELVGAE
jgi:flagellar assembly protein FliH